MDEDFAKFVYLLENKQLKNSADVLTEMKSDFQPTVNDLLHIVNTYCWPIANIFVFI